MALQAEVVDWLLEEDNPPVRYLTLTELLGKSGRSPEVRRAKNQLMDYEVTRGILEQGGEFWGDAKHGYSKYGGEFWQLIFLGEFRADGSDPRIAGGLERILGRRDWIWKAGGQCLTANILSAAIHLGYGDHPTVRQETEALAARTVADGGIDCDAVVESLLPGCYMAQPKLIRCFAAIPVGRRSRAVRQALKLLVENMVKHEVHAYVPGSKKKWLMALHGWKQARPPGQTVKECASYRREQFLTDVGYGERQEKKGWLKFGFPLHYNSDVLEAMYSLVQAGTPMSAKLERPLEVIRRKMTGDGRWIMENSLNGKMRVDVEEKGKPSKWLTFRALVVLRHFQG